MIHSKLGRLRRLGEFLEGEALRGVPNIIRGVPCGRGRYFGCQPQKERDICLSNSKSLETRKPSEGKCETYSFYGARMYARRSSWSASSRGKGGGWRVVLHFSLISSTRRFVSQGIKKS